MRVDPRKGKLVRVLEEDPALAEQLPPDVRVRAISEAVAYSYSSPRRVETEHMMIDGAPGDLGVLLLDGYIGSVTELSGRRTLELLGPGDLARPWELRRDGETRIDVTMTVAVIERIRWVLLDANFARIAGAWPELIASLMHRACERSRWQSLYAAATLLPRLQDRLLIQLWLTADRWGRVTPHGVVVPIRMTLTQLAAMAHARRPSVSTAMTTLKTRGMVARTESGGWCLRPAAAAFVSQFSVKSPAEQAVRSAAAAAARLSNVGGLSRLHPEESFP
jgi:CRP-like cAMP-binding protein